MKYIKKFESNESLTNLRVGDIVICIESDGINSHYLENGESYKIETILKIKDDKRFDKMEKISIFDIDKYYFTLYYMNGDLIHDSINGGKYIFKVERFTTEYEYSANKYNL